MSAGACCCRSVHLTERGAGETPALPGIRLLSFAVQSQTNYILSVPILV